MRFRIIIAMLAALLAACDRAPLTIGYSKMPSDYEVSAAEKTVVEKSLGEFLNLEAPPQTDRIKTFKYATDSLKVCGLLGDDRLFAGYLIGTRGNQRFEVVAVADISNPYATGGIDMHELCRG